MKRVSEKLADEKSEVQYDKSLYYCKDTFKAAKFAADSALTAVCHVLDEESPEERGFCIIRPPGHHAHASFN